VALHDEERLNASTGFPVDRVRVIAGTIGPEMGELVVAGLGEEWMAFHPALQLEFEGAANLAESREDD
jgi:hypothetical protein